MKILNSISLSNYKLPSLSSDSIHNLHPRDKTIALIAIGILLCFTLFCFSKCFFKAKKNEDVEQTSGTPAQIPETLDDAEDDQEIVIDDIAMKENSENIPEYDHENVNPQGNGEEMDEASRAAIAALLAEEVNHAEDSHFSPPPPLLPTPPIGTKTPNNDDYKWPKTPGRVLGQGKKNTPDKPKQSLEDDDLKAALALSLDAALKSIDDSGATLPPKNKGDDDLKAAMEQSRKEAEEKEKKVAADALRVAMEQSRKEAEEKEAKATAAALDESRLQNGGGRGGFIADLEKSLQRNNHGASTPIKLNIPKKPHTPPGTPTTQTLTTPPPRTPKTGTPIDPNLAKTMKANVETTPATLNLSVEKAKENRKLKIQSHETKMNDANNYYLVLTFTSDTQRTMGIEELRSKYGMFQKDEPNRVGDTELEFSVEQSIEFQSHF